MIKIFKFIQYICIFSTTVILSACVQDNKTNVIIFTIDTTRADHIGAYGKESALTPNIDALAKDGILYRNAFSPIPITLPSHSSIMTGKVPFTHGVRDNGIFVLNNENVTLAELLQENGYKTGATIGGFPLTAESGINQGFEYFNDSVYNASSETTGSIKEHAKGGFFFKERKAAQVNAAIIPWLEENQNSSFFTWVHYFDPHFPHNPPSPYNSSFINDLYQGEIAYVDENIGEIVDLLKTLDQYNNTIIIITSDHGEGLGEHNELTHTSLVYNSTLHVPLIIKYPNQENNGTQINQNVGLVDIFPTILKTLNIPYDFEIQGNILPTKNSTIKNIEIYIETLSSKISRGWGEQRGLITDEYKYIFGPQKELYNIVKDPKELNNLINIETSRAESMKHALQDYMDEHQNGTNSARIKVSDSTLDVLRGLGYLQVTNNDSFNLIIEQLNDSGDAPQDHIKDISLYYEAKNLLVSGKYIYANRLINSLLESDPDNILILELKIFSDLNLGNYSSAENTILKLPIDSYGVLTQSERLSFLGKIHFELKNYQKSLHYLKKSITINPTISSLYLLSEIALNSKENKLYRKYLEEILKIDSQKIDLINALAISYYKDGFIEETETLFKKAIKQNPFYQNSFYNYAIFLNMEKRKNESIVNLSKAIAIKNDYFKAHYSKIEILLSIGKHKRAILAFEDFGKISKNTMYYRKASNLIKTL